MHIAIVYSKYENLDESIRNINPHGATQMQATVLGVEQALLSAGHRVSKTATSVSLLEDLRALERPDVIFNLSAGITNKRHQANIVGMLEMLEIPMVGSGLSTHIMGLHKEVTKILLREAGIATARSQVFHTPDEEIRPDFCYPVLVKPEHEGSSVGIDARSLVQHREDLRDVLREKMELLNQVMLAEEFLPGREFTVGVLGNNDPLVLPFKEYVYESDAPVPFLGVTEKAEDLIRMVCPAEDVSRELTDKIVTMVKKSYKQLRCRGFARIDIRLDADGEPHVLELNTLPGLQPNYSDFPHVARVGGISYEELINRLVELAIEPRGYE